MTQSSTRLSPVARFSVFELDLQTGELRKGGVRVSLPEQPFLILQSLLERPGALVTREELRQRLWPDDTFVDFDHGLNAAVKRLRDALGDTADAPRFIETLPRRGYRFIFPLSPEPVDAADTPVPGPSTKSPWHRSSWLAVAALGMIVAAIGTAWSRWPLTIAGKGGASLRVVPLTSLSGWETDPTFSPDGDQVAFAWGGDTGDNSDIRR